MAKKRIIWQLYPPFLAVTLLSLLAMALYASHVYHSLFITQVRHDLETSAALVQDRFKPLLLAGDLEAVDLLCKEASQESRIRVTVIDQNGRVLGDSERQPQSMDNHADRPEFIEALAGGIGASERFSSTLRRNMMYLAIPIRLGTSNETTHSVRTSVSTQLIYQGRREFYLKLLFPALLIVALAATVSWYLSRRIANPLGAIRNGANRFAEGNLQVPLEYSEIEEMDSLAHAMNQMARQLNERIVRSQEEHKELETILSSMSEGIVAVDATTQVLNLNKAAIELLGVRSSQPIGRSLIEIGRNHEIAGLVEKAIKAKTRQEKVVAVTKNEDRFLSCSANPVFNVNGDATGAVLVFSDFTKQAKLETMRKDFVANVSHELKTPITSIKGYVETMLDTQKLDADTRDRFLQIVVKQTDRLHHIIEDLLQLSRLDDDNVEISMETINVKTVLDSAIEACIRKTEETGTQINADIPPGIIVRANAPLLEQAFINLLDNAIKYSAEGSVVSLSLTQDQKRAHVAVSDKGKGIPEKYHSRIFERFYRIDKARSPSNGSTGLGLAIVKHIVNLHQGEISLQSAEGQGSSFTVSIPLASS